MPPPYRHDYDFFRVLFAASAFVAAPAWNLSVSPFATKSPSCCGSAKVGFGLPPVPGKLDRGIEKAVRTLQANDIETFESCEGGEGRAYPEPTVCFTGGREAGWRAVGLWLAYGFQILCLRRVWYVLDANEPNGPRWKITFREKVY